MEGQTNRLKRNCDQWNWSIANGGWFWDKKRSFPNWTVQSEPEIDLPQVTLAGADSSLIQNDIHETMTHRTEGM